MPPSPSTPIKAPNPVAAVLDACVLYPASLRDLLLWPASGAAYAPRWTEEIHDEWIRNVLADNANLTAEKLDYTGRR